MIKTFAGIKISQKIYKFWSIHSGIAQVKKP